MKFCGHCGAPLREQQRSGQDGGRAAQRRYMTVMFCDLVESTPLAQRLDPEEFRDVLSAYQQGCVRAIERLGGYTARYVGDGVVAYFGYPRAHEDDAQRAVHAALGVLEELALVNEQLDPSLDVHLRVRIGVHSGVVVAGRMGAGDSLSQHEIVGEMPHVAARIESIASPDSVVISDATKGLVTGYFETEPLGEQVLKGIDRPIVVHRVLRPTGAVGRLEVAGTLPLSPVVGRDRELSELERAWERVAAGRGQLVHVTGEAGIGKSRLLRALSERLGAQARGEQIWQCSAHHGSTTLYPVIRCLERLLELDVTASADDLLATLAAATTNAGLDAGGAVPLLGELLSIRVAERRTLSPRDARIATLRTLEGLLVDDPARQPLLLVVEDLQWADPTTLELLDRVIRRIRSVPVLCVLTFRGEFEPPWSRNRDLLSIELGPLSREQVSAMIAAVNSRHADPAVLDWIHSAAEGVPLFVEEMLKTLELSQSPSALMPHRSVPPTLEGLLTERLDRLPDLGDVIDVASVLGREFDGELLERLVPMGGASLEPALALLTAQGVIRPVPATRARYEFTHALLQEAAYARLLRRRRHALHNRVAEILIDSPALVAAREPELVAHHYACAAEPAKAAAYWHAAGTRALERAAFHEAAEHFRRGLEALDEKGPDPDDELGRADFLTYRAASLQASRGYAAAGVDDAYARARGAYERARDEGRLVSVIRGEWMFYLLRGQYTTALELADEMLELGSRGGDQMRLSEGHLYSGLAHMYLANFQRSREHLGRASELYRRPELPDQIYDAQGDTGVGALAYNAIVHWELGYPERSLELSDRSLELADQVGGEVTRAQAWGMRTSLHMRRSEPAELVDWVGRSQAHAIETNVGYWVTFSSMYAAWLQGRGGSPTEAVTRLGQALDAYRESGCSLGLSGFYLLLGDLHLIAGERRLALEDLERGQEYIDQSGERSSQAELLRLKARALMAGHAPDVDGATAALERAVSVARAQDAKLNEIRAVRQLTAHQRKLGQRCTELGRLEELCEWFAGTPDLPDLVRAKALLVSEPAPR
jgi:class 3 adenylate cyclase/tetratricopeptide (TPR) repeat protein